jgi:ubiquinone biosynthesis protein Coq4
MNMNSNSGQTREHLVKLAKLFGKAVRDGDGAAARDMEGVLTAMMPDAQRKQQGEALRSVPAVAEMFAARPLLPPGFGPDMLQDCRPGTLGDAYVRLMREFNLTQEFFPQLDTTDDLMYFRRRMMETHDIWHVVTDCPADVSGELGVIGFYLGHFSRHFRGRNAVYPLIVAINLVAGLLYLSHADRRRLPAVGWRVLRNVRRGWRATPLFGVQWEAMWHRPIAEVRKEYIPS